MGMDIAIFMTFGHDTKHKAVECKIEVQNLEIYQTTLLFKLDLSIVFQNAHRILFIKI